MIDVENLICELHHIAGTDSVDADIRRTACDAASALASLRTWVNELQMNVAEREAVELAVKMIGDPSPITAPQVFAYAATLRGLLERLK